MSDWGATCVFARGEVRCYEGVPHGRYGTSSGRRPAELAPVPALAGAADGAFGPTTGCFWDADGPLRCVGLREDLVPRAADPRERARAAAPDSIRTIEAIRGVAEVELDHAVGCALTRAGEVYCFGDDRYGHSGDPSRFVVEEPVRVALPRGR